MFAEFAAASKPACDRSPLLVCGGLSYWACRAPHTRSGIVVCCADRGVCGIHFSKLGFCCRREAHGDRASVPYLPVCNHYAAVSLRSLSELTTRPSCWYARVVGSVGLSAAVSCSSQAPTSKGGLATMIMCLGWVGWQEGVILASSMACMLPCVA